MALELKWVSRQERDRVAAVRWQSYGHSAKTLATSLSAIHADDRANDGDYLIAEQEGRDVGTATSLSLVMWVRGVPLACQGVADVGAIKTERRKAGVGVASAVMGEMLREARRRKQVVSALMPFRASFYEHFGYGLAERRAVWTLPLPLLPSGDHEGWRAAEDSDTDGVAACHQMMVIAGQGSISRTSAAWSRYLARAADGLRFVHVGESGIDAHVSWVHAHKDGQDLLHVEDWSAQATPAFEQILRFLSSLRDQYAAAVVQAPIDWPLNRWLREPQLPHRPVNHAHALLRTITRMQVRILDHRAFLEALPWPAYLADTIVLQIDESEGNASRFSLDILNGKAQVTPTVAAPDWRSSDHVWASVALGELRATQAVGFGLAQGALARIDLLDVLFLGPKPFCHEYF